MSKDKIYAQPVKDQVNGRKYSLDHDYQVENLRCFNLYFYRIMAMAITRFRWEDMPEEIDVRKMEEWLIRYGKVLFFRDDNLGKYMVQPFTGTDLDMYGEPQTRRTFGLTGYEFEGNAENSVIIYDNSFEETLLPHIEYYAERLGDMARTVDINIRAQKTPVVLAGDQDSLLTMMNAWKEADGNKPVLYLSKDWDNAVKFTSVPTGAPFVAGEIAILQRQIWNDCLAMLGIESANTDKKERLVSDEVNSNLAGVYASETTGLSTRFRASEEINAMFGLKTKVIGRNSELPTAPDNGADGDHQYGHTGVSVPAQTEVANG